MPEEETVLGCFSPQFVDDELPENRPQDGVCEQISVADAQCAGCRDLLFRPAVLNCGHGELDIEPYI